MVQFQEAQIDRAFGALADPTRRSVLARLAEGPAGISELAAPFGMSLTGMKKHVGVLEEAGLVSTEKIGRQRRCTIDPRGAAEVARWFEHYRSALEDRLDRLGELVESQAG
jgi:DNA-binding transcriptional ArsR family regulator